MITKKVVNRFQDTEYDFEVQISDAVESEHTIGEKEVLLIIKNQLTKLSWHSFLALVDLIDEARTSVIPENFEKN